MLELLELKSDVILLPHVVLKAQTEHILRKVDQFLVIRVVKVGNYGDSIVELEAEGVD